ncbi:MAG: acyl carrier protein [Lachnospiraceae bacterium]|nr:acyl carrier protein [Candidatus Colinaster scatohippi]
MEQLLEILEGVRPDLDFDLENALVDDGILDSFDIITIVGEINEAYNIEIDVVDLLPENFNSAEAIYDLIKKLQD